MIPEFALSTGVPFRKKGTRIHLQTTPGHGNVTLRTTRSLSEMRPNTQGEATGWKLLHAWSVNMKVNGPPFFMAARCARTLSLLMEWKFVVREKAVGEAGAGSQDDEILSVSYFLN